MSNIFVIDDSISVRKALELALKKEGLNVRTAASAEAALEQLDSEPTDLIIADVIMPGLSGFELCQKLKADDRYRHIPLLIISGNVDADTRQQAHDVGAAGVLKKPFRQEELMPAVRHALASAAPAPEVTASETPASDTAAAEAGAAAMVNPPAVEARPQPHGSAFSAMVDRAAQVPGVLSAVLVERSGEVLERRGDPLPENIGQFARFYMGTADFLAGQLGESSAGPLELELGSKRLTVRGLGDKLLLTLSRL
ncbi:response regulator receiver protein (plasmid) [Deinococcus proteolyticus MRP]|uniref:Response regulator receiver protein n=1 Tax=Deinococcus proteolyticus (strain ATCC 35074 / DSM 20540 / JCM 6276 / NBRC 101906 / NCIMB 13154 / VKM Ac-1939 / CCM 2703 / MRP) TaxID=693977 RepID=F0RPT9_DEIPM|nr:MULTISPECIES: response regulator [Deinococcus]ADY27395.1 response regulator receiver protein [Deinococcus proteolyticus MRP]MCY1704270.1 response regulator [Deinococcus sp. SL84]